MTPGPPVGKERGRLRPVPEYDATSYGEIWAPIYDDIHAELDDADPMVAFLAARAGIGPVLEFAVGTGRVAIPLAHRGLEVHGIDSSPAMLARLIERAHWLPVVEGDMASTRAARDDFTLVFVVASSLFLVLDQDAQIACFANAAAHLQPGGRFVVHAFVPDLSRFVDDRHSSPVAIDDAAVRLEASVHDPVAQVVRSQHLRMTTTGVEMRPVTVRYAWPSELDLMARLAGFTLEERFGGFAEQPFDRWSPYHVSVYLKP